MVNSNSAGIDMAQENVDSTALRDRLNLKLVESEVSSTNPWDDDILNRAEIAERFTNLIRTQSVPFVVSVDGLWGTGKTFMLKRWQKDLENKGFQAIYFNAWEDDFCDDPLLAIIGQLSEHFLKNENLGDKARRVYETAIPLIRQNALQIVTGLLEKQVGVSGVTLDVQQADESSRDLLQEYLDQRATKDGLKSSLEELSTTVFDETTHPLVFIIDELDRCRPTFAIELLERVKHIFDVPNLVFVLGINRDELCKSLQTIYGEIDADIYLRRFFDMEFSLPEPDLEGFCRHLFEKFELREFYTSLSQESRSRVHQDEFRILSEYMVKVWARLGLSLRDLDYCARLLALVGKNLGPRQFMYPSLLGLLIPIKVKNRSLYRRFLRGDCTGCEVMNYVDELVPLQGEDSLLADELETIEAYLYMSDRRFATQTTGLTPTLEQLELARDPHSELTPPIYISKKTQSDRKMADKIIAKMKSISGRGDFNMPSNTIGHVASLIDFYQGMLRR